MVDILQEVDFRGTESSDCDYAIDVTLEIIQKSDIAKMSRGKLIKTIRVIEAVLRQERASNP